ncbi:MULTISPECIES: helix-turn-helix transcriptional regulator [Providencia]|uniref:Transcriptional regulator n=1 Tax=Providencia rettgeri TaxID=587 RepID=A0AAP2NV55_PRORE|nr:MULTISPECIES: helix-turn-helix transcriptional regulator [Providencia]MBC8652673.1 transcriptional regulator [Providencia vermicola]APC13287.1 YheO-like PAS domain protein [Providencia rettgeri]AVL72663.1 transcriptional regulator [Providencia rettgeri]EJD6499158.1 transcriptional regulator [Providencia rettgeri]EJD6642292.1 transcriptional regulator [Providencia rettgeri]
MKIIQDNFEMLLAVMKGIAGQFGENCEVVLHDHSKGLESSIVAIINGHVTKRKVGDPSSNLGLEVLRGTDVDGDKYNYFTQTKDGKMLRSTSIYLRDENGKVSGALCINQDISEFIAAEKAIQGITQRNNIEQDTVKEVFVTDVNEILDHLIQECMQVIKVPVINMAKKEKMDAIKFFDDRGAFLIKKAGEKICEFLNISKYTLYTYLAELKGDDNNED